MIGEESELPGPLKTPILAWTANDFGENRDACEAAGMNVIAKPVDPVKLYAALLKWLPGQPLPVQSAGI